MTPCEQRWWLGGSGAQQTAGLGARLWPLLVAALWLAPPAASASACRALVGGPMPPLTPAYDICRLDQLPPVFALAELAVLFARLDPGQEQLVSDHFLRVAAPWPYLDILGPGAGGSGNLPNEPRAVFLLRPTHPDGRGPLLLVAPARLQHQLLAPLAGGLPRDNWVIRQGPFAPTLYGGLHRDGTTILFVARPREDPAATAAVFGPDQRRILAHRVVDFVTTFSD